MSSKRPADSDLIPNPLLKKRNLEWSIQEPPPPLPTSVPQTPNKPNKKSTSSKSTSAIESGQESTDDHLSLFTSTLSAYTVPGVPRIAISDYASLYADNSDSPHGAHFVIHQHDHPTAGTHYDLRLQINETSSVSWAIMYGLPGDPNSVRLNRNATETRIHCLWNHLIETASSATGSLIIWDTGTYTVLPRTSKYAPRVDPSSPPSSSHSHQDVKTQQQLLHDAFQARMIRLQLHGHKLPRPYVLSLRLTKSEDARGRAYSDRAKARRPRRRTRPGQAAAPPEAETTDDEPDKAGNGVVPAAGEEARDGKTVSSMEKELRELEDEEVRQTNAYPGATNSICSIHQRRWYLSLDRPACGFVEERRGSHVRWRTSNDRTEEQDATMTPEYRLAYPFYIRGIEHETSIVTGRKGGAVLRDEGVAGFTGRKGWHPVLN